MRLGRFTEANEAFTLLLDATAPYLHGKHNRCIDRQAAIMWLLYSWNLALCLRVQGMS
jgi:hypothetical protein